MYQNLNKELLQCWRCRVGIQNAQAQTETKVAFIKSRLSDNLVTKGIPQSEVNGKTIPQLTEKVLEIPSSGDDTQLNGVIDRSITGTLNLSVTSIATYALYQCVQLETIIAPNLEIINTNGCYGCIKLAVLNAPRLYNLGGSALRTSALSSLDSPLRTIGASAFQYSAMLTALIIRYTGICTLSNINAFDSTPIAAGTGYVYVPSTLLASYKVATNWVSFASQIRAIEDYPEITGGIL